MNKDELRKYLESFVYDQQYLNEKVKEVKNAKIIAEKIFHDNDKEYSQFESSEKQRILNLYLKKQQMEDMFQTLGQPYRTLMFLKYISFLTFDQIAWQMNYSTKRIYQLHNNALTQLLYKINKNELNISTD